MMDIIGWWTPAAIGVPAGFHDAQPSGISYAVVLAIDADRELAALRKDAERMRTALQMLYDETADYIRLNNLGGMNNQCMQLARAALSDAAIDAAMAAGE